MTDHSETQPSFDLCVFIGRFQPLHAGHQKVIARGMSEASRMLVLVGSANEARSFRNPFTASERIRLIEEVFPDEPHLAVLPLEDSEYNVVDWIERTYQEVMRAWKAFRAKDPSLPVHPRIALIGHAKDRSSFYLDLFPEWGSIEVPHHDILNATDVRDRIFGSLEMIDNFLQDFFTDRLHRLLGTMPADEAVMEASRIPADMFVRDYEVLARTRAKNFLGAQRKGGFPVLSPSAVGFLEGFMDTPDYSALVLEYAFVARYKWSWRLAPYPAKHVTADAVVVRSGHVLMIKRRSFPGKGLWALPGGFVEEEEHVEDTAIRELMEETAIKVPPAVLRGSIRHHEVYDAPFRSSRGRTITHAFLVDLGMGPLPKTKKGGLADDEETFKIQWIPLANLDRSKCFEDHYAIIRSMMARAREK